MMNRRGLFSLIAVTPVAVAAPLFLAEAPTASNVVRSDTTGYRCKCNSHLHYYKGSQALCSWCQAPWESAKK